MDAIEWKEEAIKCVKKYPHNTFKAEDVRVWSYGHGLDKPINCRAWGQVMLEARRRNIIKSVGFMLVDNPKAHKTPATVWKRK